MWYFIKLGILIKLTNVQNAQVRILFGHSKQRVHPGQQSHSSEEFDISGPGRRNFGE